MVNTQTLPCWMIMIINLGLCLNGTIHCNCPFPSTNEIAYNLISSILEHGRQHDERMDRKYRILNGHIIPIWENRQLLPKATDMGLSYLPSFQEPSSQHQRILRKTYQPSVPLSALWIKNFISRYETKIKRDSSVDLPKSFHSPTSTKTNKIMHLEVICVKTFLMWHFQYHPHSLSSYKIQTRGNKVR